MRSWQNMFERIISEGDRERIAYEDRIYELEQKVNDLVRLVDLESSNVDTILKILNTLAENDLQLAENQKTTIIALEQLNAENARKRI